MEDDLDSEYDKPFYAFYKRPLWAFKRVPPFVNSDIGDATKVRSLGIFSIPTYCYMLDLALLVVAAFCSPPESSSLFKIVSLTSSI